MFFYLINLNICPVVVPLIFYGLYPSQILKDDLYFNSLLLLFI